MKTENDAAVVSIDVDVPSHSLVSAKRVRRDWYLSGCPVAAPSSTSSSSSWRRQVEITEIRPDCACAVAADATVPTTMED